MSQKWDFGPAWGFTLDFRAVAWDDGLMTSRQTCAHDGCQTPIMYQRFYNGGRWAHVVQYDSEGHPVTHDHTARPVPVVTNEFPWEE